VAGYLLYIVCCYLLRSIKDNTTKQYLYKISFWEGKCSARSNENANDIFIKAVRYVRFSNDGGVLSGAMMAKLCVTGMR
jgi:hypothetical protein